MRKAAILFLAAALAAPAFAEGENGGGAKKGGQPGTNVEMPFLMAPLNDADGKLIGYAYVSTRLTAMSDTYALAVRDKLPFIQHAMVLDVNAEPVATPADPRKVDIAGLERRLLADAAKVLGAGKVKAITVCTVQIADLHPVQTQVPNAPPGAAEAAAKSRCES